MTVRQRRGRLVGRERELRAVDGAVARGHGWLVLRGDPGVGKTRLLGELRDRAEAARWLVLTGRGAELERELTFGVWVDALDDHVADLGPERVRTLAGDRADELAWVLPSVRAAGAPRGAVVQDERYRAHRAARHLLERLAARRPLVVALDDLHWADEASLELVAHLLRRPPRGAILIALAYRSGQLPGWLTAPLEAATRDGLVTDVAVGSLSVAEAEDLLGDAIGPALRARVYELAGGNPFYLEQLAEIATRDPAALLDGGEHGTVPDAVAAALGQQVAGLDASARAVAWGAAVAGDPVELDVAAAAAGIDVDGALQALDALLAARLLVRTELPRRYRFRHPIMRRAVYESAGEGWRWAAHERAAAVLAASGGAISARAHHVERYARPGDEEALAVLVQAGREAAPRAPAGAARWFAAALRLLPRDATTRAQRLELLAGGASALVSAGRLEDGLALLLEALDLVPDDHALHVRLIAACAGCENLLGRHDAAHARLLRALEHAEEDSLDAAALQVELAADAIFDTDFAAIGDWAARARATASSLGERALTAVAAALSCYAEYLLGDTTAARLAGDEAAAALDAIDDATLAGRLDAPYYLGYAEYFCERYDDAIRHLERGIAVSRASGQGQFLVPMMVGLAFALEVRGRLGEARETAENAVEAARLAGNRQVTAWALLAEAWTAAMSGEREQAIRAGDEALRESEGLDESILTRANRETVAAALVEAGDVERGLAHARGAGAPDFAHVDPGRRAWLYAVLAQAELACGNRAAAEDWLARGERTAGGLGLPLRSAALVHTRALMLLDDDPAGDAAASASAAPAAGGAVAAAAATARQAVALAESVGAAVQAARSRTVLGIALGRAGRRDDAIAELQAAEAALAAFGAQRLRDEAARELRRLGRRTTARQRRGTGGDGLAALSGREREIAELVAAGHTNRAIAAQLYLSDKTVEGHLTNVFAKLGVTSRAEVAERIGRERTATPASDTHPSAAVSSRR